MTVALAGEVQMANKGLLLGIWVCVVGWMRISASNLCGTVSVSQALRLVILNLPFACSLPSTGGRTEVIPFEEWLCQCWRKCWLYFLFLIKGFEWREILEFLCCIIVELSLELDREQKNHQELEWRVLLVNFCKWRSGHTHKSKFNNYREFWTLDRTCTLCKSSNFQASFVQSRST